ncbi:MAG: hypothetical protein ACLSB9_34465 [Hydrogeniiclostridium mannosilyticum]
MNAVFIKHFDIVKLVRVPEISSKRAIGSWLKQRGEVDGICTDSFELEEAVEPCGSGWGNVH